MISLILNSVPPLLLIPCCVVNLASLLVCCVVPPSKSSDAAFFNRMSYFINFELFDYVKSNIKKLPFGESILNFISRTLYWIVYQPNPLLQIVYFVLVFGGFIMMVIVGYPMIPNPYMSAIHKYTGGIVVLGTLYAWYLACTKSPGVITAKNWKTFDNYEYAVIYSEGQSYEYEDDRPSIPKLPRSKHDAISNVVVARFDHFCPWLNNAVGEQNYRWFLLFLLMTSATLWYGIWASWSIIVTVVLEHNLLDAEFHNRMTGETIKASYRIIFQWLMYHYSQVMMLMLLTTVMGIVVTLFMLYHLYLGGTNVTTNESFKWGQFHNYWEKHQMRLLAEENDGKTPEHSMFQILTCFNCCCGKSIGKPPPPNPYNIGWKENFKQILWPKSLYPGDKKRFTIGDPSAPVKSKNGKDDNTDKNTSGKNMKKKSKNVKRKNNGKTRKTKEE